MTSDRWLSGMISVLLRRSSVHLMQILVKTISRKSDGLCGKNFDGFTKDCYHLRIFNVSRNMFGNISKGKKNSQ